MTTLSAAIPLRFRVERRTLTVRLIQLAGLVVFLVAWQIAGAASPEFYSQPTRVVEDLVELVAQEELMSRVWDSMYTLIIGVAISLVAGVTIGMLMGRYHTVEVMLEPYMAAYYSIPRVAFVPLMIIWFGIDRNFVIASVVAATTALLIFATAAGVRETVHAYREVATSFQISGWQMFTKILIPGSLPFIATGMRLGSQRALVAVIVAEFLIGLQGVGLLLREARITLATDRMFATAIVCMVMGIALVVLTGMLERRLSSWRPESF
jgi:ABC-type nitrate/sulfonate/bicarbonate transport system permease component